MPGSTGIALRQIAPNSRYVLAVGYNRDTFNPATGYYGLIDVHTGELVEQQRWQDYDTLTKARALAYSVHVGSIFGLPTKLLALAVCLVLVFGSVSGVVMWWKRRPKGRSGLPGRPHSATVPWWFAITVLALAVFLPVAGVTFFTALLFDRLWVVTSNRYAKRLHAKT